MIVGLLIMLVVLGGITWAVLAAIEPRGYPRGCVTLLDRPIEPVKQLPTEPAPPCPDYDG